MLELRHLEHFVTVADEVHFTRAAERLHITQSGLSASIKALERELDAKLFDRTTRRIQLTPEGRLLYASAAKVLAAAAEARDCVKPHDAFPHHVLRIGSVPAGAGGPMAGWVRRLYSDYPRLQLTVTVSGRVNELLAMVEEDKLDAAFIAMPQRSPQALLLHPLNTYPVIFTCHPSHRLAHQTTVSISDLGGETFIDFPEDSPSRTAHDRAFELASVSRDVRVVTDEVNTALELVGAGVGVALVPRPIAQGSRAHIVSIPLQEELVWTACLAVKPGSKRAPVTAALLRVVNASDWVSPGPDVRGFLTSGPTDAPDPPVPSEPR